MHWLGMQAESCSTWQVSAFLRDIDAGADEYNAAWDEWADQQNLPVSQGTRTAVTDVAPG